MNGCYKRLKAWNNYHTEFYWTHLIILQLFRPFALQPLFYLTSFVQILVRLNHNIFLSINGLLKITEDIVSKVLTHSTRLTSFIIPEKTNNYSLHVWFFYPVMSTPDCQDSWYLLFVHNIFLTIHNIFLINH